MAQKCPGVTEVAPCSRSLLIFASRWLQLPLYLGLIVAAADRIIPQTPHA